MGPDRPQHDLPVACVIAQQYSSSTFVSLRLDPHQKRSAALFKNTIASIYFLLLKIPELSNALGPTLNCPGSRSVFIFGAQRLEREADSSCIYII